MSRRRYRTVRGKRLLIAKTAPYSYNGRDMSKAMKKIRLSSKERRRACPEGGFTVAVRPQAGHKGYAIFMIDMHDGHVIGRPRIAKTQREVTTIVQDDLRMMHKCAWPGSMAERSRHRDRAR